MRISTGEFRQREAHAAPEIWRDSAVFHDLRDDSKLEGKCGLCEYSKVCMGCRARAYSATHCYLAEEPNCGYTPVRMRNQ